jgi:hypothetical protein
MFLTSVSSSFTELIEFDEVDDYFSNDFGFNIKYSYLLIFFFSFEFYTM